MTGSNLRRLRMQLNTFYSGPQAWFFLADERGYLLDEGLAISFTEGDTAANTIPKMAHRRANGDGGDGGDFDIGYGDLNALIEHVALGKPNAPLAVFAAYNASPYTIAVPLRPKSGTAIVAAADLAGKRLVAHPNDAALNLFAEFCAKTGLDPASVQVELSSAPHSEIVPRLLAGQWDGMFGFVNTVIAASIDAGLHAPREQLCFIEYHNHVPELYGMALLATRELLRDEPQTLQAVLRALNRGLMDTVADPEAAIHALIKRKPGIHFESNLRRLQGTLALEMGRAEGARLGIGDLDDARLQRGIDLIVNTKKMPHRPSPGDLFSRAWLPPLAERARHLYPPR